MTILPKKLMLLGSGELGKEVTIAAQRLGCTVIACDRYENAPAMQVADTTEVLNMSNAKELKKIIYKHQPDLVVPEIEALAVDALIDLEKEGFKIIPNARATDITMNRDKVRDLASKKLGLKTAKFAYASNKAELKEAVKPLGFPCLIKPVMSSSGKGQSLILNNEDLDQAWDKAIEGARGNSSKVILEEFITFNLEITLLTIRQKDGSTVFCPPIGHKQSDGDYQCSWQPAKLNEYQLEKAKIMAKTITDNLQGVGLFGVEFFICDEEVIFSELSPRPHDTGLVTLMGQNISEFELHLRAILGIPIPSIKETLPSASRVILAENTFNSVSYKGISKALNEIDSTILIFGKPNSRKGRRMGVALAKGKTIEEAQTKADKIASFIEIIDGNLPAND